MSAEENKALVRRIFEEGWNAGNLGVFDEAIAPDYVLHDPSVPEDVVGIDGIKGFASAFLHAFPDLHFSIEDQVAEGDRVVTRWTSSATHQGELMGIAPTGNRTGVSGVTVGRISGGKLAEDWNNWDTLGLMRQIGAAPSG
ncbi:MAG: ester cyclase [Actinomycetota bacterium]|nr:ester cyclase [Actinomycetota bacterium]